MDKYLLQILLETKTIIIPDLGALTITNEETGEIMFMSYLKYDDGALVKHISEKENISENDAKNIISKYVSEINIKLGQGNDYEMFQFGKFYLKDGEIEFENWRNLMDSDSIINEIEEEIPPVMVVESNVDIIESPSIEQEDGRDEKDKSLEEILNETSEVDEEYIPTEEIVEPIISKENSYTPPKGKVEAADEQLEEIPEVEIPESAVEQDSTIEFENSVEPKVLVVKKKRKPIFWILITLIVLLLALGTATILFYDQVKHYLPFMESQRTEVERNKANAEELSEDLNESAEVYENNGIEDNNQADETVGEESILEEALVENKNSESAMPVQEPTSGSNSMTESGKNYHVIGGAFEERANADRYAEKLRAAGNQSSVFGRYDGFYLVAIDSYDSEYEANKAISGFGDITTKAWVFHKR